MPGRDRDDDDAPAPGRDGIGPNDRLRRVIAALDDHVRQECGDEFTRRVLLEHDDGVHTLERGQEARALRLGAHGTRRALEAPHGSVAVDADDQGIPFRPRGGQDVDMSGVQQVEDAVREDDDSELAAAPAERAVAVEDLPGGIEASAQNGPDACGLKWISRTKPGNSMLS
jgi:hypothetical protein